MQEKDFTLPVVIVGKDRTRLVCKVIDSVRQHFKGCNLQFIHVSDNSREGHIEAIRKHLTEIGEKDFLVMSTNADRHGVGAAMNIGLAEAFRRCSVAFLLENDNVCERDIDVNVHARIISETNIGAFTFKTPERASNIDIEYDTIDGINISRRYARQNPSYAISNGSLMLHKRMYETIGLFKENCSPEEQEIDLIVKYNAIPKQEIIDRCLVVSHDSEIEHKDGEIFFHAGLHSFKGFDNNIDEKYLQYNNDELDKETCEMAIKDHDIILPVVIVGKDRTRMTCAVIDHLKEHIKNAKPYFICVSDRSRVGHDKVVENHLKEIGETEYKVLRTLPEENRYGWGCAINIGLDCAFDVCEDSDFALVVDNDWLLQRDLDMDKYGYAFSFSNMGAITFKSVNAGTNVALTEKTLADGSTYLFRTAHETLSRFSFTAEIGCMLITRHMRSEYREFKENCKTDETEWAFCNWYNSLTCEYKNDKHLWFANDRDMYHTELNGEGHVFTHVGLHSQHDGPHKWQVPEQYLYLSDDDADARICHDAYWIPDAQGEYHPDVIDTESDKIDWGKYFDKIYCFHYLPQDGRIKRLNTELRRVGILDSNIFEYRYTVPSRYDNILLSSEAREPRWSKNIWIANLGLATLQALKEAKYQGCRRVLILENDIAFLQDMKKIREILDDIPSDAEYCQLDKFVSPGQKSGFECDCESLGTHFFRPKDWYTGADCIALKGKGIDEFIRVMEEKLTPNDMVIRQMHCTYAAIKRPMCIQLLYNQCCNLTLNSDISYMDSCYKSQDVDYRDYAVPEGYDFGMVVKDSKNCQSRNSNSKPFVKKGRKFVSVYAIAKNEESVAKRWYDCVKEADEVCVLDTGSTDNTVKILRDLGAKVEVKTYDDWSFAVARNDSMKLVSPDSEILFTLDLDETIAPGWRKILEDAWISEEEKGHKPVGMLYKYIWSFTPDGKEMQSFSVRKVHAKGTGIWKYRCHELLIDVNGFVFFNKDFVVEHHQNRGTNRSKYLDLLAKDAKEMPDDDRSAYYYARELMYEGRWHEAITEFKRHLTLPSAGWRCERASSMRNIAYCYKQLKSEDKNELWLWKSAEEDPTNREATFFLGEIAMERKDYRTAVKVFARCLAIKEPSLEYISMPVVWSARPWFLYAQALWWTGHWDDAVEASRKATEIEPSNQEVQKQYLQMKGTRDNTRNNS